MELSNKTARELYAEVKANPARKRFGFGNKAILVNIDLQKAYTRTDLFKTAYETDPRQLEYVNTLAAKFRELNWPVVWTHVAYMESGEDAGIWGTRTDTPDSLQNIKFGSERSELDDRLVVDREKDVFYCKKMPSPFFDRQRKASMTCDPACCACCSWLTTRCGRPLPSIRDLSRIESASVVLGPW